jgi:hypothetical protein
MAGFTKGPHTVAALDPVPVNYEVRTADGKHWICRCNRRPDAVLHAAAEALHGALRALLKRHDCGCAVCNRARSALRRVA